MEMDFVIRILEEVHENLSYLVKVLQGQETLTPETEKMATQLLMRRDAQRLDSTLGRT